MVGYALGRLGLGGGVVCQRLTRSWRARVCRLDTNINYRKVAYAQLHLRNRPETLFLATNADSTFPSAGHMLPGTHTHIPRHSRSP